MRDVVLAIVTALKANTAVNTAVSGRTYRKGSVSTTPTVPYIIVSRVGPPNRDDNTNTGRRAHSRIQCSCFETTDLKADTLCELIADALDRTQNTALTAGASSVYVISILASEGTSDENTDIPLYWYNRDFMIHYSYR